MSRTNSFAVAEEVLKRSFGIVMSTRDLPESKMTRSLRIDFIVGNKGSNRLFLVRVNTRSAQRRPADAVLPYWMARASVETACAIESALTEADALLLFVVRGARDTRVWPVTHTIDGRRYDCPMMRARRFRELAVERSPNWGTIGLPPSAIAELLNKPDFE